MRTYTIFFSFYFIGMKKNWFISMAMCALIATFRLFRFYIEIDTHMIQQITYNYPCVDALYGIQYIIDCDFVL